MAEGILVCVEDLRSKPADRTSLRRWAGRMGWQRKYLQLLLSNTRSAETVALHSTQEITALIAALDVESADGLGMIRGLV